jgi:hypothetical protein
VERNRLFRDGNGADDDAAEIDVDRGRAVGLRGGPDVERAVVGAAAEDRPDEFGPIDVGIAIVGEKARVQR